MTELTIDRLEKVYNGSSKDPVRALFPIDIAIPVGQFVSIVGPSGCGKTTLLRMVQGLEDPTSGQVLLGGVPVKEASTRLATVFQAAALLPWFSIIRNVAFGLECRGMRRREAESTAREYLHRVGLSGFEYRYPHELSGGMQQRANLARAMAVRPDVLLMDEPYAALDPLTREDMQADLLTIWSSTGSTVLLITHQIDEAVFLSDRVLVMSGRPGQVIEDLTIKLPRPRPIEMRSDTAFHEYVDHIWHLMRRQESHSPITAPEGAV